MNGIYCINNFISLWGGGGRRKDTTVMYQNDHNRRMHMLHYSATWRSHCTVQHSIIQQNMVKVHILTGIAAICGNNIQLCQTTWLTWHTWEQRRGLPIMRLILHHSTRVNLRVRRCGKDSFRQIMKSLSPSNSGLEHNTQSMHTVLTDRLQKFLHSSTFGMVV
jgi:hypothetical protein